MKYVEKGDSYAHSVRYWYDTSNNLSTRLEIINGVKHQTGYTYDKDNRITAITAGSSKRAYTYDGWGRTKTRTTRKNDAAVITDTLFYRKPGSTVTTGQIGALKTVYGDTTLTLTYSYDANGNIRSVTDGTNTTGYVYDSANQLIRENNQAAGKTWVWTYDDGGNITSEKEYAYTTGTLGTAVRTDTYSYSDAEWGDLLTAINGEAVTSDTIGNRLTDADWTYTWENGRELAGITSRADGTSWEYTYNADGLRTKKTDGTTTYTYFYDGNRLRQMNIGENYALYFFYDADGPMGLTVTNSNGSSTYYYAKNAQGDITAIVNSAGKAVVTYSYDAWGNVISIEGDYRNGLGKRNPLRYRGYVYDTETGLYYLNSRYYDPENGRFLNADEYPSTGQGVLGNNMFAYCKNNPVMYRDTTGNAVETVWDLVSLGASIADVVQNPDDLWAWAGLAGDLIDVAIPFVGGVGEFTRVASTMADVADAIDDVSDTSRNAQKFVDTISDGICFVAETTVLTEGGSKTIETIQTGDMVWAWDEVTGDVALKRVVETYINKTCELVHVFVNGEKIISTPTHPFYSPAKGWTDACRLRAGDILQLVNGEYVVVEKIQREILETPIEVYNFQVEDYHTYYVSDTGVLVHNTCYAKMRTPDQQALADLANEVEKNARRGKFISYEEAQILDEWAMEYNIPQHHTAQKGSGDHWRTGWDHTHIYNIHVPFRN